MNIEVSELSKDYGEQKAVDAISFTCDNNEIIGFLGPNGAGKSTTMKMLTGYLNPTRGVAKIVGFDVETEAKEVQKNIGYLPESNPLYYEMYVKEYLGFVSDIHNIKGKKDAIDLVIEKCSLQKEYKKKIGQLSKGYKQRVGIAQAIIHDPKVLILDEPTSGLDANQLEEIRNLIRELGADKTILFSSHIMQEIEALCNRVLILDNGKLIADNTLKALQHEYRDEVTIIVEFENAPKVLSVYQKLSKKVKVFNNTLSILGTGNIDLRPEIFKTAVEAGDVIIHLSKEEKSIESIFQNLTNK